MRKTFIFLLILIISLFGFTGCKKQSCDSKKAQSEDSNSAKTSSIDFSKTDADMFTERDCNPEYNTDKCIKIELNGTSATADSNSVEINGSMITITENAKHIITGSLDDGMIIVKAKDTAKPQIILNGAEISSSTTAAIYVASADKVFITLAEGTQNTLSNGGVFEATGETNIDATVFSKQDLTFNGFGQLTVNSPAAHAICCKDDLVFTGGSYTINSAGHAIDANDSVKVTSASFNVNAGKDGLHAENTEDTSLGFVYISSGSFGIQAEGDGIDAGSYVQINSGDFNILSGGGSENATKEASENWGGFMGGRGQINPMYPDTSTEATKNSTSMKAIKSGSDMLISSGSFKLNSADDAIHSNVNLTIKGGNYEINSGDDAIHAKEKLTLLNGTVNIAECYEGLEALNIEVGGGNIKLTAADDGINAAGGTDSSGTTGGRDGMFGQQDKPGGRGAPGGGFGREMTQNSNGSIKITGGDLYINSSGDGMDANGSIEITGGNVTIVGPIQGDTATLDYDTSGTISGGTFIGTGAYNMAQSFSDSKQGVLAIGIGNQDAETEIIVNKGSKTILTYKPALPFQTFIFSSPEIISGENYTLIIGTYSSDVTAN